MNIGYKMPRLGLKSKFTIGLTALAMVTSAAYAQRDPAYQAARTNGQIGEKTDGYLGMVGSQSNTTKDLVNKINILRKQVYTKTAVSRSLSVQKAAFLGGCRNISNTITGEKYQAPDGSWKTRSASDPILDSACP